jgi:integrase
LTIRTALPEETITIEEWLGDTSVVAGTRRNRGKWLRRLELANGGKPASKIVEEIRVGEVRVMQVGRRMADHLRESGCKPSTVAQYRSMFPGFIQSVLGEDAIKRSVYDRLVPIGDNYVSTTKKSPTPDDLRQMLRITNSQRRAMLGIMACTGMRISEVVSRRMSDLEMNKTDGHVRVKLQAGETKSRIGRYAFLTKETKEWIDQFRLEVDSQAKHNGQDPSPWLFPGEKGGHLGASAAYYHIKRLFELAGCKDTEDETYSPHSFRTFADSQMAKAGLDRKYIALIIGHKSQLASEAHYKDWGEIETQWFELCEPKMTWLIERVEIIKESVDTKAREALAKLIAAMRKADYSDISEFVPDASLAIEDAERALEDKS